MKQYDSNLYHKTVRELLAISRAVADRPDFVQGAGGNTSAKAFDGLMAIKASGFELRQLDTNSGYAFVESASVVDYFSSIDLGALAEATDYEAESGALVRLHTITLDEWPAARPSMETGFHSILDRYVIHTHSVYANLINCQADADQALQKFNLTSGLEAVMVPYLNPGFWLTTAIQQQLEAAKVNGDPEPKVFFLQNHGIIVTANTVDEVIALHRDINSALCAYYELLPSQYPIAELVPTDHSEVWHSGSEFVSDFFKQTDGVDAAYFEANVLFPDQTVFFNGNFSFDAAQLNKIMVDQQTGKVTYRTNYREARTIDETLSAYLYIRHQLRFLGLEPRFLQPEDLDYINNMESERFRKSLLK